jgi:hypothetical protein
MRLIYIYNPHSAKEVEMLEAIRSEIGHFVESLQVENLMDVRDKYPIRATPAIIPICDHWQGDELLAVNGEGKLLVKTLANKIMEEEELVVHNQETHRLDNFVNREKTQAIDEYTLELIEGGIV